MPVTADYAVLCFTIGLPMVVGGLAARNAATEAMAASFGNFFPYMLGLENHFRISEAKWFNTAFALLCGLGFGVLVFRYILGSSALCVHDTGAEEFEACPTEHGALDHLEAADLPFDGTGGPGVVQCGLNGGKVSPQASYKTG
ncbi:FUSC family protein [Gluconacetobacter dulcium]|uniref:FUSC family protein n=1 Tax=Gluconacetobacter dulcium TaxID=2729096 RepID=UPI0038CF764F